MLTGLYLRGLIAGFVLGAFWMAIPFLDGVVLAIGLVCGVAMLAVVLADIHKVMKEDAILSYLTEKRKDETDA